MRRRPAAAGAAVVKAGKAFAAAISERRLERGSQPPIPSVQQRSVQKNSPASRSSTMRSMSNSPITCLLRDTR